MDSISRSPVSGLSKDYGSIKIPVARCPPSERSIPKGFNVPALWTQAVECECAENRPNKANNRPRRYQLCHIATSHHLGLELTVVNTKPVSPFSVKEHVLVLDPGSFFILTAGRRAAQSRVKKLTPPVTRPSRAPARPPPSGTKCALPQPSTLSHHPGSLLRLRPPCPQEPIIISLSARADCCPTQS